MPPVSTALDCRDRLANTLEGFPQAAAAGRLIDANGRLETAKPARVPPELRPTAGRDRDNKAKHISDDQRDLL